VTSELGNAIGASRCQILQPDISGPLVVTHEFYNQALSPNKGLNLYAQPIDFNPEDIDPVFARGHFLLGIDLEKLSLKNVKTFTDQSAEGQLYDPWRVRH
jgi:hypothetical protein